MKRFSFLFLFLIPTFALAAAWKSEGPYFGNVRSITVDPSNGDRIWVGTNGGGVWQSNDGGANWQLAGKELHGYSITYVAAQPNSDSIWAGVDGGSLARSTDGGKSWKWMRDDFSNSPLRPAFDPNDPKAIWFPSVNLHQRTKDGGATWSDFRVSGGDVLTFAFHPKDSKTIWAGGVNGRAGLWKTSDGGVSWKQIGKGLPESNNGRTLLVDHQNPDILYMAGYRGGFKSVDGGISWTPLAGGFPQSTEIRSFVMHPKASGTLYAGSEKGFFLTTDGGDRWVEIDSGLPNYIVNGLAFHPGNPDVMWAGVSSAGIYKSSDGGKTWSPSNRGFAAAWIKRVWGGEDGSIFAQTSRGLYRKDQSGEWNEILQPFSYDEADIDSLVYDRTNPKIIHAGDSWSLQRTTDGGVTWKDVVKPFQDLRPTFSSVVFDIRNPKIVYAGDAGADDDEAPIYKSIDGGVKWKPASRGITAKRVRAVAMDSSGVLLALGRDGGLWRSADGAVTWTVAGGGLPSEPMESLHVNLADPMQVLAQSEKSLHRSEDGGVTFRSVAIEKGGDISAAAIDDRGTFYAGTKEGVFRSVDSGKSWAPINEGLTNTDVRALHSSGSRLYAGTAGGSVYSTELK